MSDLPAPPGLSKKEPSKKGAVDNIGRRKWDMTVYNKKAKDNLEREEREVLGGAEAERRLTAPVKREPLRRRKEDLQLQKRVGERLTIASTAELSEQGGFYCAVCDCLLKDSSTYYGHINGRKHQRALGMTMRAERATLTEVKDRLEFHKRKRDEVKDNVLGVEERLRMYDAQMKREKRKKKKKKKEEEKAAEAELTEEQKAMKAMGINISFGGSKKNT
mmetsp:Transcript_34051/g.47434  ORF Transcript_34051/g.47434 Transcript_34051/m.47434 type:complete len:219 (+) Transcript_34051:109-765(+)|eukprot:CAMPEP_0185265698 /NCGR_PEP_ID=MMETSP1359-20130426/28543_1 /TAXON_ID=552665 /ORGANISM="Bigelowiella longifila, Strain CCMP242" /LENGTH=218 /DNA_ID=CAMNT_0027855145 /DNA_START=27 /DNA_END=683 /DNA_ORIENTATION=+